MIHNRLNKIIEAICAKKNRNKSKREMKWKPKFELAILAKKLGVSTSTVTGWYYNIRQPQGQNAVNLAKYYNIKMERMYYICEK